MRWLLLLVACNQGALSPHNGDGGGAVDLRAANEFCSGSARAELNGMRAESPFVSGKIAYLNCCAAAEFQVVSMQLAEPLVFMWRWQVGNPNPFPATIDLSQPSLDWGFILASGCNSLQTGCQPNDRVTEDFTGTLTVDGDFDGYQMSLCLEARPLTPHPVIQSARLWIPTLDAR
jgi:hypothetical protein